jgi:hypothetical protein
MLGEGTKLIKNFDERGKFQGGQKICHLETAIQP